MNKDFWFAQLVSITKSPFYLHRIRSTIHCGSFRHFEGQCAGFSRRFHKKPATILFNCPVVLKLSLLNLHLCLRTTATVDDFIEYQISKLRIETVLKIKLQLQRPSQNWNKSYLHCAIVELKCAFMINWMKRSKTSPKLQNQKWAGFFLLEWSKTNFDVCSLYIWVDPDQTVGKKWCQWNLKTTKNSVITHSIKYKHLN